MVRPRVYDYDDIVEQMREYIENTDDPQLVEFCLPMDRPCRDTINEIAKNHQGLSAMIKRLHQKQELYLARCGNGGLHPSMAIFRLKQKQHGYRDKQEIEQTGANGGALELAITIDYGDNQSDD